MFTSLLRFKIKLILLKFITFFMSTYNLRHKSQQYKIGTHIWVHVKMSRQMHCDPWLPTLQDLEFYFFISIFYVIFKKMVNLETCDFCVTLVWSLPLSHIADILCIPIVLLCNNLYHSSNICKTSVSLSYVS